VDRERRIVSEKGGGKRISKYSWQSRTTLQFEMAGEAV